MSDINRDELEANVWTDVYVGLLKEAGKIDAGKKLIGDAARNLANKAGRAKDKAMQAVGKGKTRHHSARAQDPGPGAPRDSGGKTKLDQVAMADKNMSEAMTPNKPGGVKEHFKEHWKKYVGGGAAAVGVGGGAAAYSKLKKKKK